VGSQITKSGKHCLKETLAKMFLSLSLAHSLPRVLHAVNRSLMGKLALVLEERGEQEGGTLDGEAEEET
jgi:hypothetical protein